MNESGDVEKVPKVGEWWYWVSYQFVRRVEVMAIGSNGVAIVRRPSGDEYSCDLPELVAKIPLRQKHWWEFWK